MDAALWTLLHVLVLVYWLGGDLGAFYAAGILSDARQPPAARAAAARVLGAVDMAPRTALILTLPTGLTLADARAWIELPPPLLLAVWVAALLWLALAWLIHLRHLPPSSALRMADLVIRWLVLAGATAAAAAAILDQLALPLFLALKLLALAAAIGLGLLIRRTLSPFGPAFEQLMRQGATPEGDAVISGVLARARPAVLSIWALLVTAAFLGLWQPQ
jgi:hypothetical protein